MNKLSSVLTRLMSEKNISSAELARKTGVAQPVVYRLMTGVTENPQILTIKPIADYFKVSIDQLLGGSINNKILDDTLLHEVNSKLSTIRTIASVLVDFMPILISGYEKAFFAELINEGISTDILPLLILNTNNLLKTANQLQDILITNNHNKL